MRSETSGVVIETAASPMALSHSETRPAHRTLLQRALAPEDQPASPDESVGRSQPHCDEPRECDIDQRALEAEDVEPQHVTLRERGQQRPAEEGAIPPDFLRRIDLGAEIESDTAQDQPEQHHRHRQVERPENNALREGKGDKQQPDGQHQPGLVGIPERADRGDHPVLVLACQPGQDADTEIVSVKDNIEQDRGTHQPDKGHGQPGFTSE